MRARYRNVCEVFIVLQLVVPGTATWLTPFAGVIAQAADVLPQKHGNSDSSTHTFDAVYTADVWRNAHGGLRMGQAYLDNLDLTLGVDGEQAWGVRGLSAYAHLLYNNSASFSERYVGDAMIVSNIDAPKAVRLYEAWAEWVGGKARLLSVRVGLYDLNSEFDTSDSRSLFIHSTHGVGHELAQTGRNGPSIFPNTSLGLRAAWEPAANWRLLVAVLDGAPGDPEHPTRTRIHLSGEEGVFSIAEAQWSYGRISKLSIGHWGYSAKFSDVLSTEMLPLPERGDNSGSYAAVEIALDASHANGEPRSSAFARYGVAEGRINEFDRFLSVGIRYKGNITRWPEDEFGLAFSRARVSAATRSVTAASEAPREAFEAAIEVTYRARINDWLTIQPDIQYIVNPGVNPALANALVFGLRFEFSWAVQR